jgi:plasmid replication initiation protein
MNTLLKAILWIVTRIASKVTEVRATCKAVRKAVKERKARKKAERQELRIKIKEQLRIIRPKRVNLAKGSKVKLEKKRTLYTATRVINAEIETPFYIVPTTQWKLKGSNVVHLKNDARLTAGALCKRCHKPNPDFKVSRVCEACYWKEQDALQAL